MLHIVKLILVISALCILSGCTRQIEQNPINTFDQSEDLQEKEEYVCVVDDTEFKVRLNGTWFDYEFYPDTTNEEIEHVVTEVNRKLNSYTFSEHNVSGKYEATKINQEKLQHRRETLVTFFESISVDD